MLDIAKITLSVHFSAAGSVVYNICSKIMIVITIQSRGQSCVL